MSTHPPEPCVVHRLPPAPHFVGREAELEELCRWWRGGGRGVLALVGLGGAGKTAVAARFLDGPLFSQGRPDGLFVWSFYQEPDAGFFLQEAYRYFARDPSATPAKGTGLLHLLCQCLAQGGPHLLVLDGLEKVQRQDSASLGAYGQIEDPLLKALLLRIAEGTPSEASLPDEYAVVKGQPLRIVEGLGTTAVLVTSRFPLTDLQPFAGRGYRHVDVGGLEAPAAAALLRSRGVQGDDAALHELVASYGAHALTLDHLGGLIGQFLGGDPGRAPELAQLPPGGDRQAFRLARLLRAYEEHLPPPELTLLTRLCLLRRGASEEHIFRLFLCTPPVRTRTIRGLAESIQRAPDEVKFAVRLDLADAIQSAIEDVHVAAPIAGPEEAFRQAVLEIVATIWDLRKKKISGDFGELAGLYAGKERDVPSDRLPLSAQDRQLLVSQFRRYLELRHHPFLPFEVPETALEAAFEALGMKKRKPSEVDWGLMMSPHDVLQAWLNVNELLGDLTNKHFALKRVRELCRLYQRKRELAGPLAPLDAGELRQVLESLVGRHLLLREADGSYSAHPAVRDHFSRLAAAAEEGAWHDLVREQLISLVQRPGQKLPEDAATLDLVEEAIHHALQAGRKEQAQRLYENVLGGLRHLGWKLGEMNRGLRILRQFDPCPDRWALAWFFRALGELEEAYRHNELPCFRADVRLLQGRLAEVSAEGDSARTAVADFLMGQTKDLPPDALNCPIPRAQLVLLRGQLDRASRALEMGQLYEEIGLEGERARCQLLAAEVARCRRDLRQARQLVDDAAKWILHSGSVEHLCLWHLQRGRCARTEKALDIAQSAVMEGLHLARHHGLGLYHIELLCEQAKGWRDRTEWERTEASAREALKQALAVNCRYLWGAATAGHLLGQALSAQQEPRRARAILRKALMLRRLLGDPKDWQTEALLQGLPG